MKNNLLIFLRAFTLSALATAASNVFSVPGVGNGSIGHYTFDYAMDGGDSRVRPVQVFDSGQKTYMQFRPGSDIPAFLTVDGERHLVPHQEGPYIVLDEVPRDFIAVIRGYMRVRITHASLMTNAAQASPTGRPVHENAVPRDRVLVASNGNVPVGVALAAPQRTGAPSNTWADYSYATPRTGDQVAWTSPAEEMPDLSVTFHKGSATIVPAVAKMLKSVAASLAEATRVEVLGRDDGSDREGLAESRAGVVADLLAASGIPRSRIVIKTAPELQGTKKGTVVGVTLRAVITHPYAPPARGQASGGSPEATSIVAKLQAGQISPSQAATQLAALRNPTGQLTGAAIPLSNRRWQVRAADGTIDNMLKRWAGESGWRLILKNTPEIQISGDKEFEKPDFLQAADYVVSQAARAGYRMKAKAYSNNVLVLEGEQ